MKASEVNELTIDELEAKVKALKAELFNLRFSHATGQLANPMALHTTKKDIARVLTILKERKTKNSLNQ